MKEDPDHSSCFCIGTVALAGEPEDPIERHNFYHNLKLISENCLERFLKVEGGDVKTLRPRLAESLFVLWRKTGDVAYRKMGLKMQEKLESWKVSDGYSFPGTNAQPSFLLSDTFKFLYLLFAPRSILSLDDFVFNTAGHPYSINKVRPVETGGNVVVHFDEPTAGKKRKVRILQAQFLFPI
jgi:hypothetical protein